MIRVLLVDDQHLFVESLETVLSSRCDDMHVVGIATTGAEAVEFATHHQLDVILMDVRMPVMDGVEATRQIKALVPEIKIVMLTTFSDDQFVYRSLDYGAVGYVLKNTAVEDLIITIRAAQRGFVQISPDIIPQLVDRYRRETSPSDAPLQRPSWLSYLTPREKEILQLMANGRDNHEIADRLSLALQTVKNHVSQIYDKLGTTDRMEAVRLVQDLKVDLRLL